jgi:hypothetical protein
MLNIPLQIVDSVFGSGPSRLFVVIVVVVMMPVVVMMGLTYSHHDLRLRRKRCREAEDNGQCEQYLLHSLSMDGCALSLQSNIDLSNTLHEKQNYLVYSHILKETIAPMSSCRL